MVAELYLLINPSHFGRLLNSNFKKSRVLTPLECERINGFLDNRKKTGMTDKKRNFMMGNALVVGIIEKLEEEIEKIVDKED